MTEEQFETLVNLTRTLALEAVSYSGASRIPSDAEVAATIAYARSQFQATDEAPLLTALLNIESALKCVPPATSWGAKVSELRAYVRGVIEESQK